MKLLVLLLTLSGCVTVPAPPPGVLMTREEGAVCAVQKCTVWTEDALRALRNKARRDVLNDELDKLGCLRGNT